MLINFIKALTFLTILQSSVPAWAVPAYVQGNYNEQSGSSCSVSFNSDVTAGSMLVAVLRIGGNVTATCTSGGQTFTVDERIGPILGDWMLDVHSLPNASGGSTTVTCTLSGSVDLTRMSIMEFSGVATSSPTIGTSGDDGSGSNIDAGDVTTNVDNALLVCAAASDSDEFKTKEATPGPGYTIVGDFGLSSPNNPDKTEIEYRAVSGTGTYSGTMSGVNVGKWAAILVAYSAEGGGGPVTYDGTYWVSTTGTETDLTKCDSETDPGSGYCSLSAVNSNADPGATINLIAGTYSSNGEIIDPSNSGESGSPITYQAYGGTVTISGSACDTSSEPAVNLNGDDYIVVDGINSSGCYHHMYITNGADYNEIKKCSFDNNNNADWNHSVIHNSQYNWIHDSQFSKGGSASSGGQDNGSVLDIGDEYGSSDNTKYNLIEYCVFFHGGHHVIALMSSYNTIRNNYIHNEAWTSGYGNRSIYTNAPSDAAGANLIEGNRWGYSAMSVDDGPVGNVVITSPDNIIRYNQIYHSDGYGMGLAGYSGFSNAEDNRIYNNTFFNNGLALSGGSSDAAVYVTADAGQSPTGNVFKNNLYYSHYQNYGGNRYSQQTYSNEFTSGDPLFTNASTSPPADKTDGNVPDLTLSSSSSPAVDAGGALTTVSSADTGAGTLLIVSDASYFQDGTYAPSGTVNADCIAVGTASNVVQISSINYSTNTITLANSITRNENDPVWIYKKSDGERVLYGSAPDAGAYEFSKTDVPAAPRKLTIID